MTDYARKSLDGVWVGDCVGNLGQLYFAHDILKALETGLAKFGGQLDQFQKQFQYSDDTEEAIVLYNHIQKGLGQIHQDSLAMGFATRYMERDPDGEIYGYGLNTRKVLRDIYEGTPWKDANKFIKKSEGMPSHIDSLVDSLSKGRNFKTAMHEVNIVLEKAKKDNAGKELVGSCGNGSAMRVAPLGAYLADQSISDGPPDKYGFTPCELNFMIQAKLQAEVTHDHEEGVAGSIAVTALTYWLTKGVINKQMPTAEQLYYDLLRCTPEGQVRQGIEKAQSLKFDLPIGKVIEVLGNGTHVTCQDTVPLCCYLTIKHLSLDKIEEMYEKAIIEASMAFGDVDTNCAIIGGMLGVVSPPPDKWKRFCQPMEGVLT